MVHRVSVRRLLFLATFVTFTIVVFQTWTTFSTDQNVSYEQPDDQSPSKNELSKEQSQNDLSKMATIQQVHLKDQLLKKFTFKEFIGFKKTIDNRIDGEIDNVDDEEEEEDSNKEPNDLKTDNNPGAPVSKSDVAQLPKSNKKDLPQLSYPKTGEIEKTDESVTVEAEDLSTLTIQDTLVETDKGLSNNKQAIQKTLVETNKGPSKNNEAIQKTLVETNKDLSKNSQTSSEKQTNGANNNNKKQQDPFTNFIIIVNIILIFYYYCKGSQFVVIIGIHASAIFLSVPKVYFSYQRKYSLVPYRVIPP
uniref:Uncharacterized protein n=1 Tax=Cacopsylla melanoneura TaxID=428564 RepID=A0A8D8WDH9_9HEMI